MSDGTDALAGGEIITPVSQPVEDALNAHDAAALLRQSRERSEAGRTLASARQQKQQQEAPVEAVEPQQESAVEAGADPPEEAPGETQEADPAELPPIEPPRSWTKEAKERWQSLPRETQEYLAQREQERDREIRRSQNEAAEARKAIEAEQAAAAKARQEYEAALPQVLQVLQQAHAGEFADIKSLADIERMATEDPVRYLRWDAAQKKIGAVQAELQQAQQRQQQELAKTWEKYSQEQDKLFAERVPEITDPEKATKLRESAVNVLRDTGFTDEELASAWNGQRGISLRDHRLQLLILDAVKYRDAKAAVAKPAPKPLPPVQRPGTAQPKGAAQQQQREALAAQLPKLKGQDAVRAAANLLRLNRQAAR